MKKAEARAIRDLLSCSDDKVGKVASLHNLKPSIAKVIRTHWTRRLLHQCAQCGENVPGDKCPTCGTTWSNGVELLQKVKPNTVLFRHQCSTCRRMLSYSAGQILEMVEEKGRFETQPRCPRCIEKEKAAKLAAIEEKEVACVYQEPTELRHYPFMALKGLKIEK